MRRTILILAVMIASTAVANAQSGGTYTIEKSVIAAGGGSSTGGTYQLEGTIGQAIAGGPAAGSPYSLQSGFWSSSLAPTAAGVTIQGRVLFQGRPVSNTFVIITMGDGTIRQSRTNTFGNFTFEDILAGQSVLVDVQTRRYRFTPQLINIEDSISGLELQVF